MKLIRKLFGNFDISDFIALVGLGMLFYGLYTWKPFVAWIIVGSLIFTLSVFNGKGNK